MQQVIIGVDPHKLSATVEVVDRDERLLGSGRFSTDRSGYAAMRDYAMAWPERIWAVEGANGAGRPLAQRLLESGEQRAFNGGSESGKSLEDLRDRARDLIFAAPVASATRHVLPWIWTSQTSGGQPLTSAGAQLGAELRLSR